MVKRILKILAWGVGGIVLLLALVIGGFFGYAYLILPSKRAAQPLKAETSPAAVERGKYLAESVYQCMWCHSEIDSKTPGAPVIPGGEFAGREWRPDMADLPPDFTIAAPNLTPHPTAGVGGWSDGELVRAMREGITKSDKPLLDVMPYKTYKPYMSDADALAIVAYLRSVPANEKVPPRTAFEFPLTVIVRFFPEPVKTPYAGPPTTPKERGEWLLNVALCHFCHDAHDEGHQTIPGRELAGGDPWTLRDGTKLVTPNISSDKAVGIGAMSDADLRKVLDEGISKSGKPLKWMPWTRYKTMTDADKDAIIAALRAAPATK